MINKDMMQRHANNLKRNALRDKITNYIRHTLEIILVIFISLKLLNVISWSWWWVLSPLWIPCIFCIFAIVFVYSNWKDGGFK